MEFIALTIVSIAVVIFIVGYALKARQPNPIYQPKAIVILLILETICMLLGKYGANWGLPWWIYYTIPMLLTIFFPTLYFKMKKIEILKYLVLTFISAPLIHILFSLMGWKNYMPFIEIPSILEILG